MEEFEENYKNDQEIGPLVSKPAGLRIPQVSGYEALARAVMGQQVSVISAMAMRRKTDRACGLRHESGLYCLPDAARVSELEPAHLKEAGSSSAKADTLLRGSRLVADEELPPGSMAVRP